MLSFSQASSGSGKGASPMLDWHDMERLGVLAGRADRGSITPEEKGEMRGIMAKAAANAWDFSWEDLLHIAFVWLGIYSIAKLGAQSAAAEAA
jgi:hypothetical protein